MGKLAGRRNWRPDRCQVPDALPPSGERRVHDNTHPIGAMEGARPHIAGAACAPSRPLPWRTVLAFSRAEHSLYAGILAFVVGLGWTVSTWSQQLGDVLILTILSAILAACLWYCFSRAPTWSAVEIPSPSLVFEYVLYLGALTWSVELA